MAIVKMKTIKSPKALIRVCDYLVSTAHDSHREYAIEPSGPSVSSTQFADAISHDISYLNRERSPSHAVTTFAWWGIIRFEDQSWLDANERAKVADAVNSGVCPGEPPPRSAWHVNRLTGACDYNIIVPSTIAGTLPILRRFLVTSIWMRIREAVDAIVVKINEARLDSQRPLLRIVHQVQERLARDRRGASLEELLGRQSLEENLPVTVATLPTLVRRAGFVHFHLEDDHLVIALGRDKKNRRRLQLDALIMGARREIERIRRLSLFPTKERGVNREVIPSHPVTQMKVSPEQAQPMSDNCLSI